MHQNLFYGFSCCLCGIDLIKKTPYSNYEGTQKLHLFSIFAEDSIDTLDIFYGVGGVWGQGSLRVTSDAVQCCIYHHKVNGMF